MSSVVVRTGVGPVEVFERRRDAELRARAWNAEGREVGEGEAVETRQWDYKRSARNPVFGRTTKDGRREAILQHFKPDLDTRKSRARGMSATDYDEMMSGGMDVVNDLEAEARRLGRENDATATEREEGAGCNCKKPRTRGMRENKIREELRRRGADDGGCKDAVQERLREAIAGEDCCLYGCPCEAEGIECHFEVCACAKEGGCGNKHGRYKYDKKAVEELRRKVVGTTTFCEKC